MYLTLVTYNRTWLVAVISMLLHFSPYLTKESTLEDELHGALPPTVPPTRPGEPLDTWWRLSLSTCMLISWKTIKGTRIALKKMWTYHSDIRQNTKKKKNKMKPTNPNADTYVEKQRFNTYLSQFPANPLVEHPDLTHWGDTLVGHPCLLRSGKTLWFDTLVGHSCLTLF